MPNSSTNLWMLLSLISLSLFAQQGLTRTEFYRKLESYFDRELIGDLNRVFWKEQDYTFYSWDAGDYSGDGNYDLVCVVRHRAEKSKRLWVYMFVDIDGFLTHIATKEYLFIELPLEVGVVIRYGVCYITEKVQQFHWRITGYRFDGVALVEVTHYLTRRIGNYTLERILSPVQLVLSERWRMTHSNNLVCERKCGIIPIYPRGVLPTHGYQRIATLTSIDYVQQGAYYWNGPEDCSLALSGAYDTNYIYLTVAVRDDEVVPPYCDTCIADRVELWFDLFKADTSLPSLALRREKRGPVLRQRPDAPLVGLSIQLGNFTTKAPTAKLVVSDSSMLTRLRLKAVADVSLHAERRDDGYTLRVRIPWLLLSNEMVPPYQRISPVGFIVLVTDVDNEFRPEEATIFANAMYRPDIVATEGEILLLPEGVQFGHVDYVYADRIVKQLQRRGF